MFRAIAIIAVVVIHTTPAGQWQVFCKPFINFAVATFIFLSGYLTKADHILCTRALCSSRKPRQSCAKEQTSQKIEFSTQYFRTTASISR